MINYTCGNQIAFKKWSIGNDVREILLASSAITAQVGQNIYPLYIPENVKGDCIIYGRDKYNKLIDMHTNVYEDECTVFLTAICDNYDKAIELAEAIDNALTGKHINKDGDRFIAMLADSSETFQDDKIIETLTYSIK